MSTIILKSSCQNSLLSRHNLLGINSIIICWSNSRIDKKNWMLENHPRQIFESFIKHLYIYSLEIFDEYKKHSFVTLSGCHFQSSQLVMMAIYFSNLDNTWNTISFLVLTTKTHFFLLRLPVICHKYLNFFSIVYQSPESLYPGILISH